jgi:hypothetical protein
MCSKSLLVLMHPFLVDLKPMVKVHAQQSTCHLIQQADTEHITTEYKPSILVKQQELVMRRIAEYK